MVQGSSGASCCPPTLMTLSLAAAILAYGEAPEWLLDRRFLEIRIHRQLVCHWKRLAKLLAYVERHLVRKSSKRHG